MEEFEFPRLDKTVLSIVSSFEEADEEDRKYWHSRTPIERLQHTEYLRRINYGDSATARLQRVIEIVERA
ncbi:MAG: hypothetical protein KF758_06340 [Anaerolineales bacterium]|nr:hypothetical protein [Anaerolineales bacterium]MBX3036512.1 hypothetical protein [Anaerolineales bacterium]